MRSLDDIREEYEFLEGDERYRLLIELGRDLEPMPDPLKTDATQVRGCSAAVWVYPTVLEDGRLHFLADSNAAITKGIIALVLLVWINYFSRLVLYAAAWSYTAPQARAAREAAARENVAEPVQGPPLPSGDETPLTAPAGSRSSAKPFLAGVAAGAGVLLATRRRKDDD